MIAAATQSKLLFNWFDLALVMVLGFGFWRGRKHGMTREIIPFLRWLFIVLAAGFGYHLLGNQLLQSGILRRVSGRDASESTTAYVTGYLLIAGVVTLAFLYLNKLLKPKLENSNFFGSGEYYLGMVSGFVRYACIVIFALALLHAPYYTRAEIAARQAYNNRWYGGGLKNFKGDYIPTVDGTQNAVFHDSLLGPFIEKSLSVLLIDSRPEEAAPAKVPVVNIKQ